MDELLRRGIVLFNDGEFFACHEVLEEAWTRESGPRREFLQAIIHVAVGMHHLSCGNPRGASGQLKKALNKLAPYVPACEGIDTGRLYADVAAVLRRIDASAPAGETLRIERTA